MFGEEVSESPRQPSPWEAISAATTPEMRPTVRRSSSSLSRSMQSDSSFEMLKLDSRSVSLSPEVDTIGHIEYKLKLVALTPERLQKLVTQLKWRLLEGGGSCYYEIGVRDDGAILGLLANELDESLSTLERMAAALGATCEVVREITLIEADPSEDGDDAGPAPDNPLLARPRQRCIATPSLDPTPELSDSETSVTSALGELARLQVTDSDEEPELPLPAASAELIDELPPRAIEPGPVEAITLPAPSKPLPTAKSTGYSEHRRRKKAARRQASRLRKVLIEKGVAVPPTLILAKAKPPKVISKRPPKPSERREEGQRYAAEVLITLGVEAPLFLDFDQPFGHLELTED